MDSVLRDTVVNTLKSAATPEARNDAIMMALIALVDCQASTSRRVKILFYSCLVLVGIIAANTDTAAVALRVFHAFGG